MVLFEYSPFGVIGAVAPSTNPTETIINNSISMLAAGNSVYFSPIPARKGLVEAYRRDRRDRLPLQRDP